MVTKQQVNPLPVEPEPPQVMHENMLLVSCETAMRDCAAKHPCSECANLGLCESAFSLLVELVEKDPRPQGPLPLVLFIWTLTGTIVFDPLRGRFVVAKKS